MFDPKLKEALGRVQKPGRYTGGEPGSVYKDGTPHYHPSAASRSRCTTGSCCTSGWRG